VRRTSKSKAGRLPTGVSTDALRQLLASVEGGNTAEMKSVLAEAVRASGDGSAARYVWGLSEENPVAVVLSEARLHVVDVTGGRLTVTFERIVRFDTQAAGFNVAAWGLCLYMASMAPPELVRSSHVLTRLDPGLTFMKIELVDDAFTKSMADELRARFANEGYPRSAHRVQPFLTEWAQAFGRR